jgi:predicted transcriptional regulator
VFKLAISDIFQIISGELLKDNNRIDTIYTGYSTYTFRVSIIDTTNISALSNVKITLDPIDSNIQLLWNRSTGKFLKISDPNNFITLESSSKVYKFDKYFFTIDFNVSFNWNYPDENYNDIQIHATKATLPEAWLNISKFYRVENDLVFSGNLTVTGSNNRIITNNSIVSCGENLTWTGLLPVYEGSTEIYPPEEEFNISIWDETGNKWFDSPASGEPFEIHNQAPVKPFPNGFMYIINISGIPLECDHTDEMFTIKIDWRNLTFTNATPDDETWQTVSNVSVGVTITNIGLGLINGSTVMNSISTDNGTSWGSWKAVSGLKSAVGIYAQDSVILKEGKDNLIRWRANDSYNNMPIQSENYRILVDTKDVVFSDELPSETTVSESGNVTVGITISDITSGVRASTIEYTISKDNGTTWGSWTKIIGQEDDVEVRVRLNLTFQDGDVNRIKWRASDVAGNGPAESKSYTIKVKITTLKPNVQLQNPINGSIITKTYINLSWTLVNSNLSNIKYDIILDTISIPTKIIKANYTKTNLIVTNLTNSTTYYWQVIPKLGSKFGLCISGIWSFTVNISYPVPSVLQIYPVDKEILPSKKQTLSWSLNYSGNENVVYDIYLDTNYPPKLLIEKHPYTNFTLYEELEDGKIYYWKIVPRVDDLKGPASEIWSFTVDSKYRPSLDFDLKVEPAVIELKPREFTEVKIIIINSGELRNNILFSIKGPANDTSITLILPEFNEIIIEPKQLFEFYITIRVNKSAEASEVIFNVEAVSLRAIDFGFNLKKNAQLSVRIISEDTQPGDSQKANYFWAIYLIVIVIVILFVLIFLKIEKDKLLLNFQRKAIFEAIKSNPGIHFRELMRNLSLKSGTLSYHINLLEKKDHIKSIQKGIYRCFYPTGATSDFKIVLSTIQQRMLVDIKDKPGISLSELSYSLGKNKMLLYYHANLLEDAGVIIKEKRGRISTFYITPKATLYLE